MAGPQFGPDDLRRLIKENQAALGGRQMILTFKKSGRIKEDHVYDSANLEPETQHAIRTLLWMCGEKNPQGKQEPRIGTSMIGKGFIGIPPWVDPQDVFRRMETAKAQGDDAFVRKEQLDFSSPMRVADVVEQPNGTILVTVESV